jgi:hypothetical protein
MKRNYKEMTAERLMNDLATVQELRIQNPVFWSYRLSDPSQI